MSWWFIFGVGLGVAGVVMTPFIVEWVTKWLDYLKDMEALEDLKEKLLDKDIDWSGCDKETGESVFTCVDTTKHMNVTVYEDLDEFDGYLAAEYLTSTFKRIKSTYENMPGFKPTNRGMIKAKCCRSRLSFACVGTYKDYVIGVCRTKIRDAQVSMVVFLSLLHCHLPPPEPLPVDTYSLSRFVPSPLQGHYHLVIPVGDFPFPTLINLVPKRYVILRERSCYKVPYIGKSFLTPGVSLKVPTDKPSENHLTIVLTTSSRLRSSYLKNCPRIKEHIGECLHYTSPEAPGNVLCTPNFVIGFNTSGTDEIVTLLKVMETCPLWDTADFNVHILCKPDEATSDGMRSLPQWFNKSGIKLDIISNL